MRVVRETKAGKAHKNKKGLKNLKQYVELFTCLTTGLTPHSLESLGYFVVLPFHRISLHSSNAICFHSSFFQAHRIRNCNKSIKAFRSMHISTRHLARTPPSSLLPPPPPPSSSLAPHRTHCILLALLLCCIHLNVHSLKLIVNV